MARIAIVQLRSSNFDTIESDIFGTTYDKTKYQKPNTNTNTDVNLSESLLRKLSK